MIQFIASSKPIHRHNTIPMAITAIVIGVILGLGIALIRLYRIKGLSQFFQVVVTLLKGIPMVLIILALYLIASKQFDVWSEIP